MEVRYSPHLLANSKGGADPWNQAEVSDPWRAVLRAVAGVARLATRVHWEPWPKQDFDLAS